MNEFDDRMVAAAEADLRQLLSIQPSPEFAARVRANIHEKRKSPAKRWGWIGLAIATAAALVFAAILRTDHTAPATQNVEIVKQPDMPLRAAPPAEQGPLPPTTRTARHVAIQKETPRSAEATASPEIIIDSAMTAAIRRMAMSLRTSEPDASAAEQLQTEVGEPAPLTIAEPLNVPELVLKPADQNGGNQE
jgi:hypothetical protein